MKIKNFLKSKAGRTTIILLFVTILIIAASLWHKVAEDRLSVFYAIEDNDTIYVYEHGVNTLSYTFGGTTLGEKFGQEDIPLWGSKITRSCKRYVHHDSDVGLRFYRRLDPVNSDWDTYVDLSFSVMSDEASSPLPDDIRAACFEYGSAIILVRYGGSIYELLDKDFFPELFRNLREDADFDTNF